jgi:hypothetical protein
MREDAWSASHGCPCCRWPIDPQAPAASRHRTSLGDLRYLRCRCGAWLVVLNSQLETDSDLVVAQASHARSGALERSGQVFLV